MKGKEKKTILKKRGSLVQKQRLCFIEKHLISVSLKKHSRLANEKTQRFPSVARFGERQMQKAILEKGIALARK